MRVHAESIPAPVEAPRGEGSSRVERLAGWLSMVCALHCLVTPLVIGALPLLGAAAVELEPGLELALSLMVVVSALVGTAWGYRRHRDVRVVVATGVGLAGYLSGHALEPAWYGVAVGVLGALLLAASGFMGARLSQSHGHCHTHDSCAH